MQGFNITLFDDAQITHDDLANNLFINANDQHLLGKDKVIAIKDKLRLLNPFIQITSISNIKDQSVNGNDILIATPKTWDDFFQTREHMAQFKGLKIYLFMDYASGASILEQGQLLKFIDDRNYRQKFTTTMKNNYLESFAKSMDSREQGMQYNRDDQQNFLLNGIFGSLLN